MPWACWSGSRDPTTPRVSDTLQMLALVALDRGALGEARALFDRSLKATRGDALRQLVDLPPPRRPFAPRLSALRRTVEELRREGRLDDAARVAREAAELALSVYGSAHVLSIETANDLAVVLLDLGEMAEAQATFEEAVARAEDLSDPRERRRVACVLLNNWAGGLRRAGAVPAARDLLIRAVTVARSMTDDGGGRRDGASTLERRTARARGFRSVSE